MNQYKERSKAAFDSKASSYDHSLIGAQTRQLYPVIIRKFQSIRYSRFLDLGCGTGALIGEILAAQPDKQAYGIDLSEKMIGVARGKLGGKAELTIGDAEHLPYKDAFFDAVCCNFSFHHYPAPKRVAGEVARVLKPGGVFLIGDEWFHALGRGIVNIYFHVSHDGDVKIYSEREYHEILEPYFNYVMWEKVNDHSCLVTAMK
jgi:ubiquinone/menaquinone biosynthesis C-methylase UbiE